MIVCMCHGINDRALNTIVENGASTMREVGDACGAGTDCGQCCREILERLRSTRDERREDKAPLAK